MHTKAFVIYSRRILEDGWNEFVTCLLVKMNKSNQRTRNWTPLIDLIESTLTTPCLSVQTIPIVQKFYIYKENKLVYGMTDTLYPYIPNPTEHPSLSLSHLWQPRLFIKLLKRLCKTDQISKHLFDSLITHTFRRYIEFLSQISIHAKHVFHNVAYFIVLFLYKTHFMLVRPCCF